MSYSLARLQKMRAEAEKAEADYNDPYDNDGFIYRKRPPVLSSCSLKALEEKERKYHEVASSLIKELDPNEEHITIKKAVRALDKHALGESEGQYELPDGTPVDSPFRFGARYVSRLVNPNALEDARSDLESEIAKSIKKKNKKPASKKRKRNIWGYGGKSRKAGRSDRRSRKAGRVSRKVGRSRG